MKDFIVRVIKKIAGVASSSDIQNLKMEMQRLSTKSSAEFILEEMGVVQSVTSWDAVHNQASQHVSLDGHILEFGVYSGRTINYIASLFPNKCIHGFDSFEGLPEAWRDGFDKNRFSLNFLPDVHNNVVLHKGWFNESIPEFLHNVGSERKIAYLHIDCDLYSSTKIIFNHLGHLFVDGTVIVFDEYFNYPGWELGEHKAFKEFIASSGFEFEWLTYNCRHEQVAVKLIHR